jgi:Skp family chaperone for outer membrane proteins
MGASRGGQGAGPDYLVVDMQRVLEECAHGRAARAALRAMVERTEPEREKLVERAEQARDRAERKATMELLAELDRRRREELDRRRDALRTALVGLIDTVVRQLAEERQTELVLERRAALVFDPEAEVTAEVIRRVDLVQLASKDPRSRSR